jgi:septal ring-binding cell division protein DamX
VNVDRYREGLDVYRAGDLRKAAELWAALSSGGRLGEYTVQIEVACSPETITKDFPPLERLGEPFLLPRAVKGRACYALCLGRFPSKDEAEALLKGLPASYVKDGATVKSIRLLTGQ